MNVGPTQFLKRHWGSTEKYPVQPAPCSHAWFLGPVVQSLGNYSPGWTSELKWTLLYYPSHIRRAI
jgi:hypothetical protein